MGQGFKKKKTKKCLNKINSVNGFLNVWTKNIFRDNFMNMRLGK